jgi:predicted nucleotidyltransferase
MINSIGERIRLHAVVLFGSRARGDAHEMSDYDLVIIADFKEPYNHRRDWVVRLAPMISVDLFCFTPVEFRKLFDDLNLTAIDAIGEGIVLAGEDFIRPYKEQYEDMTARGMRKTDCLIIPPREA